MINHFRTVLRNVNGSIADVGIGDAYVPPDFRTIVLPQPLLRTHRVIFGSAPDAAMRNYRLYELLRLIAGTTLQDAVLEKDSRVTYQLTQEPFFGAMFGELISEPDDPQLEIVSTGPLPLESSSGALYYSWRCALTGGDTVNITQVTPERVTKTVELEITNGIAAPFTLPGSLRTYTLAAIPTTANWGVSVLARPKLSLGELYHKLNAMLSDADLFEIFRNSDAAYRRGWETHHDSLMRLACLVVAWVQRADALRGAA